MGWTEQEYYAQQWDFIMALSEVIKKEDRQHKQKMKKHG